MAGLDELRELLQTALNVDRVTDLTRLSGGASRETWRFLADGKSRVVQRQRAGDERDMMIEAATVAAASRAGVPVPELLCAEQSDAGSFMILDAIEGETIARKILRDDDFEHARSVLPAQLGQALATVHAMPPDAVEGLPEADPIAFYTDVIDSLGEPYPMLELVRRWLLDHRPTPSATTIVHGDFRLGNLIIATDGLRAVIDWELAHVGDPMEDLGWLCVKAWRFGQRPPVAGLGDYEELFAAYADASGTQVDADVVRWWEVLGTWKWAVMCILQASAHLSGAVRSHELAAIGRRVCENEHDLFLALEGRW